MAVALHPIPPLNYKITRKQTIVLRLLNYIALTHFMSLVSFITPQKTPENHQENFKHFLMFSASIEIDQWHEMDEIFNGSEYVNATIRCNNVNAKIRNLTL